MEIEKKKLKMTCSFNWHNATQFLGALNDNIFQGLMIFFLIGILGQDKKADINAMAAIIFVIPFLLFTPFAGNLADWFSKQRIIVAAKAAELAIMIIGCIIFYFHFTMGIYVMLFFMCTQSAFFGPCKYGIVPELVHKDQITKANSFMEGMTYLAIVIGAAAGPLLSEVTGRNFALAGVACIILAAIGLFTSTKITKTAAVGEKRKPSFLFVKDVYKTLQRVRHDRDLILTIWASAYFMLIGGFAKINLIPYGMEVCKYSDIHSGYLFVVAAVGIGVGSYLAGRLSGRNVEMGIVPLAAIGMAITSILLGLSVSAVESDTTLSFFKNPNWSVFTLVLLMGVSCGLYIVPIHSFIQLRAPEKIRGRVLAASNFLGWIGVFLAALLVKLVCGNLGVPSRWMFIVLGFLTLGLAIGTVIILPDFLVRLIVVLLTRTIYRIRVRGEENVPIDGPALLVANHVSWADAVVLMATQQRRIRFMMDRGLAQSRWFGWLFRLAKVIPVSPGDSPKRIQATLQQARQAMDDGYLVCIFAEGGLTRTGLMGKFRSGFEKVTEGTDYKIIPTYIGGLWGSILSHYHGKLLSSLPRRFPYPVQVHFAAPMPSDSTTQDVRWAIEELAVDFYNSKKAKRLTLAETFVKSARRHWAKSCMSDTTGKSLSFGKTLIAVTAMADKLKPTLADQKNIGVFLPSSIAGGLANLAVAMLNKVSANLSYTASEADRNYMIETAEIKTVLTSRKFLEKLEIDASTLPNPIFMEDLVEQITDSEKRRAMLKAIFTPRRTLAHRPKQCVADDTATILFSSGSSGRPKGVELTHHNILSNLEGALSVFRVYKDDRLCGILPFFHSFGLSCTLWLPIMAGVGVSFVPNPLDAKAVGKRIRKDKCTLLFATPTFLLNYFRRCEAEDFATVRFIIAGAEKLKPKLIDMFDEKFGVRPCEGYGATECSPLIALNVPDAKIDGVKQVGTKEGTVGHTVPGLAVKILDPESGEPVSGGQPGVLYVKGPNVMKGYLKLPEKTEQVLKDDWYNTGDIVSVDPEGFVTIHDRLSRFSKIGGEMVPHMTIEEVCLSALNTHEPVIAVTSVPDEKKGEKLVILYDRQQVDGDKLYEILAESELPKLYIPKRDNLIGVDEIPHLGSGKLDIMKLRQTATEYFQQQEEN